MSANIKESLFDETVKIDENTKLLDVLADELETQGMTADVDVNGFKEINGLNFKGNTKVSSSRATQARANNSNE